MSHTTPQQLLQQLQWRYATKQFDPTRRIPAETWEALEQSLVLTPSSFGLQPWRFYIIQDTALREKLVAHSWNQRQVADASHLVAFAAKTNLGSADVDALIARTAQVRNITTESLKGFHGMLTGFLSSPPPGFDVTEWCIRQVYIALGQLMASAAALGLDACPMEGFDAKPWNDLIGCEREGYRIVVLCPVGYRASTDKYASLPKVRYEEGQIIKHL